MGKYVAIVLGLIGLYLILQKATEVNGLFTTLAGTSLKGVAVLQGRDVVGVTR